MASPYMQMLTKTLNMKQIRERQLNKSKEIREERITAGFREIPTAVPNAEKITDPQLKAMLSEANVRSLVKPAIAKGLDIKGVTYTTNQLFVTCKADARMNLQAFEVLKDDPETYNKFVDIASKYAMSSGTPLGFIKRYCVGASKPNVKPFSVEVSLRMVESLKKNFIVGELPDFTDTIPLQYYDPDQTETPIELNVDASSGLPYFDKTEESFDFHMEKAQQLFLAFKRGQKETIDFIKNNNWITFFTAKNKKQLYAVAELEEKVRPYFVLPNAKKFLYLCLAQPLCEAFQCFTSAGFENTTSAYHFTWFDKGQDKLYARLCRYKDEEGRPDYICFGDDSLVFWWEEGELKIVALDISMLDGSVRECFEAPVTEFLFHLFEGKLDQPWSTVLFMMCKDMFKQNVLLYKSTYVERQGVPSGLPATTLVDMLVMGCYFDMLFHEIPNFLGVDQGKLDETFKHLTKFTGLTVKAGTSQIHVATDIFPSFLGMAPNFILGYPVFENYEKLVASMFHPGEIVHKNTSLEMKMSITMSRAVGLALCGGFHYPEVFDLLERSFEQAWVALKEKDKSTIPVPLDFCAGCDLTEVAAGIYEEFISQGKFPDRSWFRSFYTAETPVEKDTSEFKVPSVVRDKVKKEDKDWGSTSNEIGSTRADDQVLYVSNLFSRVALGDKPTPSKAETQPQPPQVEKKVSLKDKAPKPPKKEPKKQVGKEEVPEKPIEPKKKNVKTHKGQTFDMKPILEKRFKEGKSIDVLGKDKEFMKTLIENVGKTNSKKITQLAQKIGFVEVRDPKGRLLRLDVPESSDSDGLNAL